MDGLVVVIVLNELPTAGLTTHEFIASSNSARTRKGALESCWSFHWRKRPGNWSARRSGRAYQQNRRIMSKSWMSPLTAKWYWLQPPLDCFTHSDLVPKERFRRHQNRTVVTKWIVSSAFEETCVLSFLLGVMQQDHQNSHSVPPTLHTANSAVVWPFLEQDWCITKRLLTPTSFRNLASGALGFKRPEANAGHWFRN